MLKNSEHESNELDVPRLLLHIRSDSDELDNSTPVDIEVLLVMRPAGAVFASMAEPGVLTFQVFAVLGDDQISEAACDVISSFVYEGEGLTEHSLLSIYVATEELKQHRVIKTRHAIEKMVLRAQERGTMGKHLATGLLTNVDDFATGLLDSFRENGVGQYQIRACYHSLRAGTFNAALQSRLVPFEIRYREARIDKILEDE